MIEENIIEAYALENALVHNGKAEQQAILKSLFAEGLKKDEIKDVIPVIKKFLKKINSMSLEKQEQEFEKTKGLVKKREVRVGLSELSDAEEGKVVMRFAPFPSGALHIGNTRQMVLNDEYAKKYKGKLLLVMDDTIGSTDKPIDPEAYELIKKGVDWLDIKYSKIVYKSDRLRIYYEYAEELIKKGYMYVCSCSQEEFQDLRKKGVECSCRHLPVDEQLERWKKMFNANVGDYVVRLKTSMSHPNPAFRDRVMFRISEREHPRVKKKYRVWPLLEFSWAIDDHLFGITHIIRGIDLMMETHVEEFIWDIFKWKKPVVIHTGFFSIQGVKISKSKGAKEVKAGEYIGWNDPRAWSLQALRDRGILPEAIREFCINMGLTKANSTIAVDVLYALNRKHLEKVARYFFVPEPVKIKIKGCPKLKAKIPLHPSEKIGEREYETEQEFYIPNQDFDLMQNANYRLMHLFNFKSEEVLTIKPRDFSFISEQPDKSLNAKMIQWVVGDEKGAKNNVKVKVRMPDNSIVSGVGEAELLKLKVGTLLQFERFGFVRLYKVDKKGREMEFWFSHQ